MLHACFFCCKICHAVSKTVIRLTVQTVIRQTDLLLQGLEEDRINPVAIQKNLSSYFFMVIKNCDRIVSGWKQSSWNLSSAYLLRKSRSICAPAGTWLLNSLCPGEIPVSMPCWATRFIRCDLSLVNLHDSYVSLKECKTSDVKGWCTGYLHRDTAVMSWWGAAGANSWSQDMENAFRSHSTDQWAKFKHVFKEQHENSQAQKSEDESGYRRLPG